MAKMRETAFTPEAIKAITDKVPAFKGLTMGQIHKMLKAGEIITRSPGDILCREEDRSTEMFILLSGQLVATRSTVELTEVKSADIVGEMSLITGLPRSATLQVTEEATMFMIRREQFSSLLRENLDLAAKNYQNMLESLCGKLLEMDEKFVDGLLST